MVMYNELLTTCHTEFECWLQQVTPALALELNNICLGMVELGYNLQGCNVDWYKDYHVGNVCRKRIGTGYTWVDIEEITTTTVKFDVALRRALVHMFRPSFLEQVPGHIRAYWSSLRKCLADISYKPELLTHDRALFIAKIGEALQAAVPVAAPSLEPRLHTEAASSSTYQPSTMDQLPRSELKAGPASLDTEPIDQPSTMDQLPKSELKAGEASLDTEPQAQTEMQSKRSKTEALDVPGPALIPPSSDMYMLQPGTTLYIPMDSFGIEGAGFIARVDSSKKMICGGFDYEMELVPRHCLYRRLR
jgi:hypothetical protein